MASSGVSRDKKVELFSDMQPGYFPIFSFPSFGQGQFKCVKYYRLFEFSNEMPNCVVFLLGYVAIVSLKHAPFGVLIRKSTTLL
jgi:hypothetical protein